MVTEGLFFPLETIKTRLQSSANFLRLAIFKEVYRGFRVQMLISFPAGSLYFVGYEGCKFIFDKQLIPNNLTLSQKSFLGGIGAEFLRTLLANPFEIAKQQIQVGQQSSLASSFRYIIKTQGFSGLYRGFWSLLGRDVPFTCIMMPIYEVSALISRYCGIISLRRSCR